MRGLSLVAASRGSSVAVVSGLHIVVASRCRAQALRASVVLAPGP